MDRTWCLLTATLACAQLVGGSWAMVCHRIPLEVIASTFGRHIPCLGRGGEVLEMLLFGLLPLCVWRTTMDG